MGTLRTTPPTLNVSAVSHNACTADACKRCARLLSESQTPSARTRREHPDAGNSKAEREGARGSRWAVATPESDAAVERILEFCEEGIKLAKPRKPNTARKPPVPSDSHADIEDWIRRVMPDLHPIVERLDESIRETIPGLRYAIKWKNAYYGLPELGWIIEMVAYDVSVNVVFFGGAEFDPPPPLGTTERTRYVKVKTLEEAQGPEMHKWIEQAGRVPGWK